MLHAEKSQGLADIRSHLKLNGSRKWGALRKQYDMVSEPTWWRWVREAKSQIGTNFFADSVRQNLGKSCSDSPGGDPQESDFLSAYIGLWSDASRLRTHALHVDGRVRNPAVLDRAIRIRLKLLRQGLELERQIFSARAQRAFYDALVEEIATESPALQRRIISRLRRFNGRLEKRDLSEARSDIDAGK
jgi:hypothetical protein